MSFSLAPFVYALSLALQVHARVIGRAELMGRPEFVSKAVAARLRRGVAALAAYLRRILILMALKMEHSLVVVERPENLARAKARLPRIKKPFLRIYPRDDRPYHFDFHRRFGQYRHDAIVPTDFSAHAATLPPATVSIRIWLAQLDHLHALATDPLAKAKRLAFALARRRHGLLMAPGEHPRLVRRWGTEVMAIHDAMAAQIMAASRSRPPPLPPPRRGPKPTITVL